MNTLLKLSALLFLLFHPALQAGESDAPRAAHPRLEELEMRDAPLRDALALIGEAAGLNLSASDDASKIKVNIRLRNVTPLSAVQSICQTHGLFFNRKKTDEDGIDIVTTVKEFQEGLTVFREEKTVVYTLLYPNAIDLAVAIRDLFGERVRVSLGKDEILDESTDIERRFSKFDLLDERSMGFTSSSSSGGSGGGGGGGLGGSSGSGNRGSSSRGSSSGGSSLGGLSQRGELQRDFSSQRQNELRDLTPEQLERIAGLVQRGGAGVGLDAEKLRSLGRNNNSPIYVSVIARNNQMIVRSSDSNAMEEIARLKLEIDVPTPQVLLEMKILSVDLSNGFRSVFDTQFGNAHNTAGFSTGDILPPPSSGAPALTIGGSGNGGGPNFALNPSNLVYQFVNDNFRARLQLLNNTNRVTTIATPLLLVANNEVSRVFVGQERPIVNNISSQTVATQGVITSTPNTSFTFQPVGTTLLITPSINADRTVTLRLVQETSSVIAGGATIPVVNGNGNVTNQPVDVVSAQTLTGTLVAKDGLSLALGGLIEEGVQDNREGVPVLGKIPGLGIFFRRQATGRYRREIIIVIRPYILTTPCEAEQKGKRVTDANSIHPKAPETTPPENEPIGSMDTYLPREALRPNPPRGKLEELFRLHDVKPSDF